MGLIGYACCGGTIGDPHEGSCPGSPRYPLGREREAAERHVREIRRQLDTEREQPDARRSHCRYQDIHPIT